MPVDASEEHVEEAVEYSSYENMKKMESKKQFRFAGGRMMPRDKDNPDSYKVRRAKVAATAITSPTRKSPPSMPEWRRSSIRCFGTAESKVTASI